MSEDYVIRADNVWKRYGLPWKSHLHQRIDRLRGQYNHDPNAYGPWRLKDISFEVKQGESLGIVGKNGAGKSTLLKLLAGVSPPTRGSIDMRGRLFPMIELAAGMHRDLTGRENIKLLGAIMGFNDKQVIEKMPVIEDFSELGEWLDMPMWQYSSGMQARLGFSVAVNVDADILLIDEVLSVGDVNFQKKCLTRMDDLVNSGVTVLFVSHNPYAIERLCNRAIYLQDGEIAVDGEPADILTAYFQESVVKEDKAHKQENVMLDPNLRPGTGDFRVQAFTFHDPVTGEEKDTFVTGDAISIRIMMDMKASVSSFSMSLRIHDSAGTTVANIRPAPDIRESLDLTSSGYFECTVETISLLPGVYWFEFMMKELGGIVIDHVPYGTSLTIVGTEAIYQETGNRGFVYMPGSWAYHTKEMV